VDHPIKDPYGDCEAGRCNHDLVRGLSTDELLATDGPYPPSYLIVNLGSARPTLFDDMEEPLPLRRAV
jgi:hypothetical protein